MLAALVLVRGAATAVPESVSPLAELRAALDAGDLTRAVRAGEAAVAADPKSAEASDLLGRAYGLTAEHATLLEQMRLARKARACFARAVELDGTSVPALADLARYDMRAPGIIGGGKKKARASIARVLALDPPRGHVLAGELAELEKDPACAESEFRAAIDADPLSAAGWNALSSVLLARRKPAEARRLWEEAGERGAGEALAAYGLGGVALASGDGLPEAARGLAAALEHAPWGGDPSAADGHERLAAIYAALGRRTEAAGELEAALRIEPERSDWRRRLSQLSSPAAR
ncbi:MAG: tetratricopeptide repeat protein [Syntrophomonadaceae bacterium]